MAGATLPLFRKQARVVQEGSIGCSSATGQNWHGIDGQTRLWLKSRSGLTPVNRYLTSLMMGKSRPTQLEGVKILKKLKK